ncbi:MAG: hypothetical protein JWO08_3504 [Verrucomicrobiaceae bacterium]|nr:hypothetical protein [Verrucomicrobiaceae bacterium]
MNRGARVAIAIVGWCACVGVACARDAFFAPDGKTVTLITSSGLGSVNIETGIVTLIALPKVLKAAEIQSIARGAHGEILFLAQGAVWVLEGQGPVRQICKTTPLLQATDLVVVTREDSSVKNWMLVSAWEKASAPGAPEPELTLYGRKPRGQEFGAISCRRTPNVACGTFTQDGRFFFACEGDVWEGYLSAEPDEDPNSSMGVLTAARVAPLSVLSTDFSNAGAMSVADVAVAGKWIYVMLHGHHMGAIVRAPMPAHRLDGVPSVSEQYQLMAGVLAKAEVITEDGEYSSNFCVSEVNGKTQLFWTQRRNIMLWEGKGELKVAGKLPEP